MSDPLSRQARKVDPLDAIRTTSQFNPEGSDYDYESAAAHGMKRDSTGHMGSVVPTNEAEKYTYGLGDDSYRILKGRQHETFDLAVQGENERGSRVVKRGSRYYSTRK